jgi:hypothetical protein
MDVNLSPRAEAPSGHPFPDGALIRELHQVDAVMEAVAFGSVLIGVAAALLTDGPG